MWYLRASAYPLIYSHAFKSTWLDTEDIQLSKTKWPVLSLFVYPVVPISAVKKANQKEWYNMWCEATRPRK